MECLNPRCGAKVEVEDQAVICNRCGAAMPLDGYVDLYASMAADARVQILSSTVGETAPSYTERMDQAVNSLRATHPTWSPQESVLAATIQLAAIDTECRESGKA